MAVAYRLPAGGLSAYRAAHPGVRAGELFSAIQTDWYWRIPAIRLAGARGLARAATSGRDARRLGGVRRPRRLGWPRYDVARRRAMHFDTESRVVDNPLARELAVWQGFR
jgi:carboxylesterase type B